MKIKSTEIKAKLEKLNKDITNNWMIIRTENLVENGFKRHYDMKALLDDINKKDKIEYDFYNVLQFNNWTMNDYAELVNWRNENDGWRR